jgi:hypothetical protein
LASRPLEGADAETFRIQGNFLPMKLRSQFGILALSVMTACASNSASIAPAYVSPVTYEGYTCNQLSEEAQRVSRRASVAAGVQDQRATNDAIATGVALVIFWPAAFLVSGGDGHNAAELARLRGQMEAIEDTSIKKKCGLTFHRAPPPQSAVRLDPNRHQGPSGSF